MALLYCIIIIDVLIVSYSNAWWPHYNLYTTDGSNTDFSHDCMYWTITDETHVDNKVYWVQQIIEYCIRPSSKENDIFVQGPTSSNSTFDQLKQKNVTGLNLLEWSSPIDLVERYERYLQIGNVSSTETFSNCTVPWFGSFCQYNFGLNHSFSDIMKMTFYKKRFLSDAMNVTCYVHLECNRGLSPICLDWREVCDGKVDCLDGGEDEKHCFELETNRCANNEYQCRNGMCVDDVFRLDDYDSYSSPECLDRTDELQKADELDCWEDTRFRCEEAACRSPFEYTCGDGQCINWPVPFMGFYTSCSNRRDRIFNVWVGQYSQDTRSFAHCLAVVACASGEYDWHCKAVCKNREECQIQIHQHCPYSFVFPAFPVWDSHVRLGYISNQALVLDGAYIIPHIVCYNQYQCSFLTPTVQVNNYTCRHFDELDMRFLENPYEAFVPCTRLYESGNETRCRDPSMLRCPGTNKCIPKRRIVDGIADCYDAFDESVAANSCELNDTYRFNCTSEKKCLSHFLVDDGVKQCLDGEDEMRSRGLAAHIHELPFSALCDSRTDMVFSGNDTDETDCERWACMSQYTRCNGFWNCLKGIDELNCPSTFNCSADHHPCLSTTSLTITCLHVNRTEDGIVDCFGATDERAYCRLLHPTSDETRYRCWNDAKCVKLDFRCEQCGKFDEINQLCNYSNSQYEDIREYIRLLNDWFLIKKMPFSLNSSRSFPTTQSLPPVDKHEHNRVTQIERFQSNENLDERRVWLCNRGIAILVGQEETEKCLCPPSYYGHRCQYQNQRVSLTLRLRKANLAKLDIIGIVLTLVDHTGFIHSHDQLTYIPTLDCNTKFNVYLLYQDRPKNMTKNYTIRVDAYDKVHLIYLASWTLPILFPFLPVSRVSAQLTVPAQRAKISLHVCRFSCDHRHRTGLRNTDIESCQCDSDWSEANSTVRHECDCSPDSICVGLANNRSICLCPLTKTGPRCLLNSACQLLDMCINGGLCVPGNDRSSFTNFRCLCQDGFSGKICDEKDAKIEISFSGVAIPQSLLVHFITVRQYKLHIKNPMPIRATTFKRILLDQATVTFYMSFPFHLVFAQIENTYYLVILQHGYVSSAVISTQIKLSQRCPHIRELLDEVTVSYPVLRRVKSYHVPCNELSDLVCFHDNDTFMCLCTEERNANCFHFDFKQSYICPRLNDCENGARCFQDHPTCPTKTMCVCEDCFYGTKYQLTTKGFGLSLDAILGYHIRPRLTINQQSALVKVSIAVATLMLIVGLVNGILSTMTFQKKSTREVGCGLYLLAASITSILIIIIFNLKVWLLILSQMSVITSRSFLLVNCISMYFILRSLLCIADWFSACAAVERALIVIRDINFEKIKSKRAAKWVILAVPLFTVISVLHDPSHRDLIEDEEEGQTWCLARYTPGIETFNAVMNIFHFIVPFLLNFISAIIIIIIAARKRSSVTKLQTYKENLKEQFHHHKHLILSSIALIILALPRLTISFMVGCMKSARDPKLFLAGYFISFIPPLLTLFIFVLPSKMYKKEFDALIKRLWKTFHLRSSLA